VTIEAERFVLSQYKDAAQIGVDAIGKGDVDNAVKSAKGHRGLGAIARQRPQSFTLASGEKDADGFAHIGHGLTPGVPLYERVDSNSIGKAACKPAKPRYSRPATTFCVYLLRDTASTVLLLNYWPPRREACLHKDSLTLVPAID
jgi:hypothetical protein